MKSVQLQPSVERHLTLARADSATSTRGLLLGSSTDPSRLTVLVCVPTPLAPSSWRREEWFTEHARQVKRMLVGGCELVGCYIQDTDPAVRDEAIIREMIYSLPISAPSIDRYLIKSSGSKLSCEAFTGTKKDGTKPKTISSIKVASLSLQLICFQSNIDMDFTFPIVASSAQSLKAQVKKAFEAYHQRLLTAPALIDGTAIDTALILEKAFDSSSSSSSSSKSRPKNNKGSKKLASSPKSDSAGTPISHDVDFFLTSPSMPSVVEPEGLLRIRGTCHARSYAHQKQTVAQALTSLRHDLLTSLQSRLQLLCEDSEATLSGFSLPSNGMPFFTWSLPRRLMVALTEGGAVCDYLLSYETETEGLSRIDELLNIKEDAIGGEIEIMESSDDKEPQSVMGAQSAAVPPPTTLSSSSSTSSPAAPIKQSDTMSIPIAAFVAVAIAIGLAFWLAQ